MLYLPAKAAAAIVSPAKSGVPCWKNHVLVSHRWVIAMLQQGTESPPMCLSYEQKSKTIIKSLHMVKHCKNTQTSDKWIKKLILNKNSYAVMNNQRSNT